MKWKSICAINNDERGMMPVARDTSQSNYRRGVMSLVILSLLREEDMPYEPALQVK